MPGANFKGEEREEKKDCWSLVFIRRGQQDD